MVATESAFHISSQKAQVPPVLNTHCATLAEETELSHAGEWRDSPLRRGRYDSQAITAENSMELGGGGTSKNTHLEQVMARTPEEEEAL